MKLTAEHSKHIYILAMGVFSAVLYSTMFFMMAFLLPIMLVYGKHGFKSMLQSAAFALGIIFLIMLAFATGSNKLSGGLLALSPALALVSAALFLVWPGLAIRDFVTRVLLSGLLAAVISLPIIYYMFSSAEFSILLDAVLQQTTSYLQLPANFDQDLSLSIKETLVNFFGVSFFLIIFVSAWLSSRFMRAAFLRSLVVPGQAFENVLSPEATRKFMAAGIAPLLPEYRVPINYLWLLMGAWGLLLASRVFAFNSVIVSALAWNTALALSICYAVQGLAILFVKLLRTRMAPAASAILPILLLVIVVGGVTSIIVSVGLALLGTLETWLALRIPIEGDKP